MKIEEYFSEKIRIVNTKIDCYLELKYPFVLYESMRYSALSPAKRVRPILLLLACDALGGNVDDALPFACAIEMIHAYSLIHDDLPALDNDDLRRGKPTNHIIYGEDIAILAGDGLLNTAHEIMADKCLESFDNDDFDYSKRFVSAMKTISSAAGADGMIAGQVVDIKSNGIEIDKSVLEYISTNKTSQLLQASLVAGAYIAGANDDIVSVFRKIGLNLGIAFQIKDDILDVTSSLEVLGKPINSDAENNKSTYTTIYGIENAEALCEEYSKRAIDNIHLIDGKTEDLLWLVRRLLIRKN